MFAQSCPTLCDPTDYSQPGSSVYGIFQARILEWVAISYFRRSFQARDGTLVSCVSCIDRWILYHIPPGKSHYCIRDLQNGTFVILSLNWLARLYTYTYMERKTFPNYLVTLNYVPYKKDRLNICLSFYLSVFIIWLQHFKSNSWCFSF